MATANENFRDALLRHQIGLLRLSGSIRNEVWSLLDATEQDLVEQIRRKIKPGGRTPGNVKRLQALERAIVGIRGGAWGDVSKLWKKEFTDLALQQPQFIASALLTSHPLSFDLALPSPQLLKTIVTARPFDGKILRDWSRGVASSDLGRIMDEINIGLTQGESNKAIARRVVGTRAQKGADGVTAIARRDAAAITRTATNHVSNQANREFFKENEDVFSAEIYTATLDGRTTPVCRSLDGRRFPVGVGPIPPLHFQCRSLRVAAFDDGVSGERFSKPVTDRQLLREFSERNNFGRTIRRRSDLPRGFKGKFDSFARSRVRELIGKVPARVTYQEWLSSQSAAFQDDVLGKARGKLFRQGKLSLTKFVNRAGDEIPLRDLARNQRQAFIDAGLDPADF